MMRERKSLDFSKSRQLAFSNEYFTIFVITTTALMSQNDVTTRAGPPRAFALYALLYHFDYFFDYL